ncbi:MAG: DMT family transporter [Chlamydiales bacterium]|nr:DMT family transporter [Chlamydiia bacterium]MCP5504678.1 DMT family transporter [Chlamydiales bacterium]
MIQHLKRPQKRLLLAISLMIIASLALAIQAMFVKLASDYLSTNFLTFARSFVNLILLLIWVVLSPTAPKISELYKTKNYRHHAVRSIFGVGALYCFYFSINHFSLATGTLIFYSFPLFVPLVSRVWLRVKFVHRLWWGLGIAFIGLLFVMRPGEHLFNPLSIIPLIGAMLAATAFVAVRTLNYTEPWERITAYFFTTAVLVTAIVLHLFPDGREVYTFKSLSLAFLAGLFAAIFQVLMTVSAKFAPMRLISPLVYLSFVFGAIIQFFIWGVGIPEGVILGFCLIVVGTILLIFLYPKDDLKFVDRKPKEKKGVSKQIEQ